ncbi:MAG TPA: hypothetical protein VNG12_20360 [Acidimicrobiales bacterium]|nr:hypothetical protein [Acidimicrobiales bacterium]
MSKDVSARDGGKSVSLTHGAAMVGVGVVGAIVAFWLLSSIVGIIFFFVKVAVIIALIAGAFWLVEKVRR